MNIVGTHWLWLTRYLSIAASASSASNLGITTAVPPSAVHSVQKMSGAEW